jgi:hemerythrin
VIATTPIEHRQNPDNLCVIDADQAGSGTRIENMRLEERAVALEWSDKLCTGISLIDEQHRGLFDLVKSFEQAAGSGKLLLSVHTMDQLNRYVRTHFSAEEDLMRTHHFPNLTDHIAEHRQFSARLFRLIMENVRRDNSREMLEFLSTWLVAHIAGSDMEYVPYLLESAEQG